MHPQKGFTFWEVHATGGGPYYGAPMLHAGEPYREPAYVTDRITDNALSFLEQQIDSDRALLPERPLHRAAQPMGSRQPPEGVVRRLLPGVRFRFDAAAADAPLADQQRAVRPR